MYRYLFTLLFLSYSAIAQRPEQLMDFPFYNYGSYTGAYEKQPVEVNNSLIFVANDGIHGDELWRTDGSKDNTVLLKDIYLGKQGSSISQLTAVGNEVFFIANTPETGFELWKSDGTTVGTQLVKDITEGPESHYYVEFIAANGLLYFISHDRNGNTLWQSDGTEDGTMPVQENILKDANGIASLTTAWGELIYVVSNNSSYDLIRTNGKKTTVIATFDDQPVNFFFDGRALLYFDAYVGTEGYAQWRTDGTPEGTIILKEKTAVSHYVNFLDETYFIRDRYLCKTDGTPEGTIQIKEVSPYSEFIATDQYIIFSVYRDDIQTSIWRSDGTAEGTIQIKDSLGFCPFHCTILKRSAKLGNTILFSVSDQEGREELWQTDGTSEGTFPVKTIREISDEDFMSSPTPFQDATYFFTDDGSHGAELWRSDGTEKGTFMLKDINQQICENAISNLTKVNDHTFYFSVEYYFNKIELWKSDGTKQGTLKIANLPGSIYNFTIIKDTLYFQDRSSIWKSDGTTEGTKSIYKGDLHNSNGLFDLLALNDKLIFYGPPYLMKIEPTVNDTIVTRLSSSASNVYGMTIVEDKLFFAASSTEYGAEIWVTDASVEGTKMLKDIMPGNDSSNPISLTGFGNQCIFTAYDGQAHKHWISDGTGEGTKLLSWTSKPYVSYFSSGNILYLSTWNQDSSAYELWKSHDGNSLTFIRQIKVSDREERIYFLAGQDSMMYFTVGSCKLWKSDGTTEGTVPVKDIREAGRCNYLNSLHTLFVDQHLYFYAMDSGRYHLWVTEGTDRGTYKLSELTRNYPTFNGQAINDMVNIGDYLLYANSNESGYDALYRLNTRESEIPVNVAPTITGIRSSLQVNENDSITIDLENFLVEDPDHNFPEDFSLIIQEGEHYSINHPFVYPEPGFSGDLTVPVQVSDGQDSSEIYMLTITVLPVNEKPLITGVINLPEISSGEEFTLTLDNFLIEDEDNIYPDDFTLTILEGAHYTIQDNLITTDKDFTGELYISVKVNDGQDDSDIFIFELMVEKVTGLANSKSEADHLKMIPNPVDNTTIELQNNWTGKVEYKVVDASGRPVKEGSFLKKSYLYQSLINLNGLPSGVYYFVLSCKGQSLQTKIVVP